MTLKTPFPAGDRAGTPRLRLNDGQQKTLLIAGQGRYSVRTRERLDNASLALRNPPKHDFEVSRHETIV